MGVARDVLAKYRLSQPGALAFLAALLPMAIWALLTLIRGVDLRDFEQHIHNGDPGKLKTPILAQSFVSTHDNISRVELQLNTPIARTLPADLGTWLGRGEGPDSMSLDGSVQGVSKVISDTSGFYLSVAFPPVQDSAGVTYTFLLKTPGYSVNSVMSPAWSTVDALSSGAMYTEDGAQGGDLAITVYYRYTLYTMMGDVWDAITGHWFEIFAWLAVLLLPGLALLVWMPNGLNGGQRMLAAPGLSALLLPTVMLLASLIGLPIGTNKLWVLLVLCALAIGVRVALVWRGRPTGEWRQVDRHSVVFWLTFAAVTVVTIITRLVSLRDLEAGVGMDAYHHTMVTALFVRDSGIPPGYEPFVPLTSFTYHFGFHTLSAVMAWLTGTTQIADLMTLVPRVGQIAGSVLPIPALTLFGWRVLGNRWVGLVAGALAGLVSVVPAFYVEWSRYTQGLGLAVLPVAWVLFVEAVGAPIKGVQWGAVGNRAVLNRVSAIVLAVIGAAGLFLTHYRIIVLYAGFVALYVLWITFIDGFSGATRSFRFYVSRFLLYASRTALVGILSLILVSPWLINFASNFVKNSIDRNTPDMNLYFETAGRLGAPVLNDPSLAILADLCALGLAMLGRRLWWRSLAGLTLGFVGGVVALGFTLYVWVSHNPSKLEANLQTGFLWLSPVTWSLLLEIGIVCALLIGGAARLVRGAISREAVVALPVVVWLMLALGSSPQLLPFRLPFVGYLDSVTLASSAWLPACLLAAYAVVTVWQWLTRLAAGRRWLIIPAPPKAQSLDRRPSFVDRLSPYVLPVTVAVVSLGIIASGLTLAPIKERRQYIEPADMGALTWMRDNLPRDSYVLVGTFKFAWSPTQPLGLDSGLWIPLVAGVRSSVPSINAYNEKPRDPQYFSEALALSGYMPLPGTEESWQALKAQGITHIYVGTRSAGDGFSMSDLLKDDHVQLIYHRDAVWLFRLL